MHRLFSLISQGLGLDKDCLQKRMGDKPRLRAQANFYPPCPDPELTLGLAVHTDFNALTLLRQSAGVTGLQVIKDGKWVAVDPIPNAFVINLGDQIQVILNLSSFIETITMYWYQGNHQFTICLRLLCISSISYKCCKFLCQWINDFMLFMM